MSFFSIDVSRDLVCVAGNGSGGESIYGGLFKGKIYLLIFDGS